MFCLNRGAADHPTRTWPTLAWYALSSRRKFRQVTPAYPSRLTRFQVRRNIWHLSRLAALLLAPPIFTPSVCCSTRCCWVNCPLTVLTILPSSRCISTHQCPIPVL